MILKIIGSVVILLASTFLGYTFSRDCGRRPQELRSMQSMLKMFQNEISFLSNILSEAFEKIYRSSSSASASFFKGTIDILRENRSLTASEAWELAVKENIGKTSLNKEDGEIVISFGKMLGSSDLEGQLKNIEMTLNQLHVQEQKAEEKRNKYETMYRTLGVLGGLTLVIILI